MNSVKKAFYHYTSILEEARKSYHNSEQWYDDGPSGYGGETYQEMLDRAEEKVLEAINEQTNSKGSGPISLWDSRG